MAKRMFAINFLQIVSYNFRLQNSEYFKFYYYNHDSRVSLMLTIFRAV